MRYRVSLLLVTIMLVLTSCVMPAAQPTIEPPSAVPANTAEPIVATPTPPPTGLPATPMPTAVAEPEAGGVSDEEAAVSAGRATSAQALGVDPGVVKVIDVEAVTWRDSCLGVNLTEQVCAQAITPGYRIVVEVDGVLYAVHTNQNGSSARFAGPAGEIPGSALDDDPAMAWRFPGEPCQEATITLESVTFGACDGATKQVRLASEDRQDDLAYYTSVYASFDAATPAGALRFTGAGPAVATPAEQRMMAEWAGLVAQAAATSRSDASWGLAMAWHREGGFAGFCDDLAIYVTGNGLPSTCQTEPPTTLGKRWLTAGQVAQFFAWVDALASFETGQKDPASADAMTIQLNFIGSGAGEPTEEDQQAMLDFAAQVFTYGARATDVRYVQMQSDLVVLDGPGSQFAPIGELFAGQIAFVTGVSADGQWWRVICADGTVDDCWITADPQLTQPTEPPGQQSLTQVEVGLAVVDSIDILIMESMPVQVNVLVRGNLPDGCTTIGQATTEHRDTIFVVTLTTQRPVDAMCTEALVPYEQTVPLDVVGLSAGVYTVTVNGVSDTFELAIDNVATSDS